MRKLYRGPALAALVLSLAVPMGLSGASGAAAAPGSTAHVSAAKAAAAKGRYYVPRGVIFNSATGSNSSKYQINNRLKTVIDHAPRKSLIRIMSWNVMSRASTDHLLKAQRRGVTVRILMDSGNSSRAVPNPQWRRLQAGLSAGNHRNYHYGNSAARVCHKSCRGTGGQAHSKYYLFSQSGGSKDVVMEGSANFTEAAATNQWNDLYTFVGSAGVYKYAGSVFEQMWRDRPVGSKGGPYTQYKRPSYTLAFSPIKGKAFGGYPTTNILKQYKSVKCRYTQNGKARRTVIRMFPDVMRNGRGLRDAWLVKQLWDRGCDVKVGYTVLSVEAHRVLTKGGPHGKLPLKHAATDPNHDGQFDKYFHLKVLTFNGKIGNSHVYRVVQGSSNLSGASASSDENMGTFKTPSLVNRYQKQLSYWYSHMPRGASYQGHRGTAARGTGELLTPSGRPAADSDGYIAPGTMVISPTTGQAVDPYALIDQD